MKALSHIFTVLKAIFISEFTSLDVAELLQYDWDGMHPRRFWHGWCDLWGSPYSVIVNNGSFAVEGGWVDVRHLHRLLTTCRVIGSGAGATGRVDFIFQAAYDLVRVDAQWFPDTLRIDVMATGVTEVLQTEELDVEHMNYIRIHSVNNNNALAVTCRVTTPDAVRPINLNTIRRES